jgi:anti-sigma factor RsiW
MTHHDTFTEKLSLWLDGELNPVELAELQAHLAGCSACQHSYQALQRVDLLFRAASIELVGPRPGFSQRFEARLAQQQAAALPRRVWWGVGVLLLGTLLLFIIAGLTVGTAVSAGLSMIGVPALYSWLDSFITASRTLGVWFNLAGTFLRACLATMSQPLFWGCAAAAAAMAGLWLRLLQKIYQRTVVTVELLI